MPTPFRNSNTGQIETYGDLSDAQKTALQRDRPELRPALPEEIEGAASYREHATALEQLKAAGELGVDVASLGTLASDSPEAKARRGAFRQESPFISGAVEQGAALIPAAVAGAATAGLGAAAGFSAATAARAAFVAESLSVGTAVEREQAREQSRDIDISNVVQGLALDVATAGVGRLARGVTRRVLGSTERAAGALERAGARDLEAAAESPATSVARGNRISKERRQTNSVGARAAEEPKARPPERAEVQDYARNREFIDADVDELGYNAINDAIGGDAPAFDAVHNIGLKQGDVAGRMKAADEDAVFDFVAVQTDRAEALAVKLEADGAPGAAGVVREHIGRVERSLESESFAETAAIELDQMKRTLDRYRTRFGAAGTKAADPLRERVQWIDDVLDPADQPLRKGLEDRGTWGEFWADKQLEENADWSGSDRGPLTGLINTGKVWMRQIAEPHAGIRVRRGLDEVPVFKAKGDIVKIVKGMNERDFGEFSASFDTWIERARHMNQIKSELGVDSINHTPIARLATALDQMAAFSAELKQIRKLEVASEPIRKHIEKMGESKALTQTLYEGAREMPGIGQVIKTGEKIPGVREKISEFLEPQPGEIRERPTPDEALGRIGERQRKRREGWTSERAMTSNERAAEYIARKRETRKSPAPKPDRPSGEAGFAEAGAVVGAGATGLGVLGAATYLHEDDGSTPMTDALAELSDHSRAIMDRAALGLVAPDSRAPRLPSVIDRFKGDAPDARTAFANVLDMLQTANNEPAAFVDAMTEAFGDMGAGGHDDLAQRVIARTAVAVQYLLANLPPSLANSVTRPEGAPVDTLAIATFAKMWSGAMRPGDVIYDVGTGRATPTQIRALREVHPDIYTNLRISVLRALGEARSVPFETKRQLDNLFDIDGAAGASFSSVFAKTMATARADKAQSSKSLGGESVLAPQSANKLFSSGPSALR